jgi:hypothetical protein
MGPTRQIDVDIYVTTPTPANTGKNDDEADLYKYGA